MWDRVRLRVRNRVLKLCWMLFYFWKPQSKRPLHFFALTNFVISISVFEHKSIRRVTRISPNGNTMNHIDLRVVTQDWKCNIKNSRSYLIIQVTLDPIIHLAWPKSFLNTKSPKYPKKKPHTFDVSELTYNTNIIQNFEIAIGRGFVPLMNFMTSSKQQKMKLLKV